MVSDSGMQYVMVRFRLKEEHPIFGMSVALLLMGFAMGWAAGGGQSYRVSMLDQDTPNPRVELSFRDTKVGEPSMRVARRILEDSGLGDYFDILPDPEPVASPVTRGGLQLLRGGRS